MKKIIVIDNYDSFTYNLVHYIEKLTGKYPDVYRNDEISIEHEFPSPIFEIRILPQISITSYVIGLNSVFSILKICRIS